MSNTSGESGGKEKKTPNIQGKTEDACVNNAPTSPPCAPQVHPPQPEAKRSKHKIKYFCKCTNLWFQKQKHWFEIIALFAAIALVYVDYCQWGEMKEDRILDERAWLGFSTPPPTNEMMDGCHIFKLTVKNTGKTPALREQHFGFYTNQLSDKTPIELKRNVRPGLGIIPPDEGIEVFYPMPDFLATKLDHGNQVFYTSIIWYDDVFGHSHWTRTTIVINPKSTDHPNYWTDYADTGNDCDTDDINPKK